MEINTYVQAIKYLENFIGKILFKVDKESAKKHDPLERMRIFLSLLDNPQEKFRSILVGGTSGKGSTAYLISHILTKSGYKTGLTLSPHLQKVNERLQINGKEISDLEFTEMVNSMIRTIELMKKMPVGAPSYFEIIIAMAFTYFAREKVDLAVVEVGMGGEFDATNTLNPLIAVLTNVGLDHTNILGNTVEKIARTKAGIIKFARGPVAPSSRPTSSVASSLRSLDWTPSSRATPHLLVISGVKQPAVIKIVEERCEKVAAQLLRLGKDFNYKIKKTGYEGSVFDLTTNNDRGIKLNDLQLSLIGNYQMENASLAVETVLQIEEFGFSHFAKASRDKKISDQAIREALKTAFFPGRFEIIRRKTQNRRGSAEQTRNFQHSSAVVLDGAHNPTKMKAFLTELKKLFPKQKKIFIIGFKFDKDIKKMLSQIVKIADEIIITEFRAKTDMSVSASAKAESIKYQVLSSKYGGKVSAEKDSGKALEKALAIQQSNNNTIIIVTGSLYLVGEIRGELKSLSKM